MTVREYLADQAARLSGVPGLKTTLLAQARSHRHDFLLRKAIPDPEYVLPRADFRKRVPNPYYEQALVEQALSKSAS